MNDKCRLCSDTLEGVDLKFGICSPCWFDEIEAEYLDAEAEARLMDVGAYDPYDDGLLDE